MSDPVKGDVIVPCTGIYPDNALVVSDYDDLGDLLVHPLGGGMQIGITPANWSKFRHVTTEEQKPRYRRARFEIDGIEESFDGYTAGLLWNGWERPMFCYDEAKRIVEIFKAGHYEPAINSFITWCHGSDELEKWEAETIRLPDEQDIEVYPVGAGSWTWSEYEEIEATPC